MKLPLLLIYNIKEVICIAYNKAQHNCQSHTISLVEAKY